MELFTLMPGGYYKAYNATIVGDVTIGADCSFWYGSVVRADIAPVVIGRRTNLQDGAVIHTDTGIPNVIGDDVLIGHRAIVHGMSVGSGTIIGMGAVVLSKTRIGKECFIAAGAVVPPGLEVPDRMMVMGVPGRIVRPVTDAELEYVRKGVQTYLDLSRRHAAGEFASH